MKTRRIVCLAAFLALSLLFASCASEKSYKLTEETFFLVMTNMQYNPEQYAGKEIEYDCFTYLLEDTEGNEYFCGVRKCSSGYGCNCGKDTIIGFLLSYEGEIPAPKNQSEDTPDKTWVHLKGTIPSSKKTEIKIFAYNEGEIDYNTVETVVFLSFEVSELTVLDSYEGLSYYVTK